MVLYEKLNRMETDPGQHGKKQNSVILHSLRLELIGQSAVVPLALMSISWNILTPHFHPSCKAALPPSIGQTCHGSSADLSTTPQLRRKAEGTECTGEQF